ncbi:EthD domain-containing protein [Ustulina deusta]|nr:EthD domain-containing protein [Ustulina deusta]
MPSVLIFAYRELGTTPEQFKAHYEGSHVPLVRELAGASFPLSHTRRYLHRTQNQSDSNTARNPSTPATVLIGTQDDFDYDAIAELTFEDAAAFQTFFSLMQQPENAAKIAADEDKFLDRTRMPVVVLGDITETRKHDGK